MRLQLEGEVYTGSLSGQIRRNNSYLAQCTLHLKRHDPAVSFRRPHRAVSPENPLKARQNTVCRRSFVTCSSCTQSLINDLHTAVTSCLLILSFVLSTGPESVILPPASNS